MKPGNNRMTAGVACIGAVAVDQAYSLANEAVAGTSNPGRRMTGIGGVAHNVASNLVRLGATARLVSVVGDDSEGRAILEASAATGVDVSLCTSLPSAKSGSYTAILEADGSLHIGVSDLDICDAMEPGFISSRWQAIATAAILFADCNLSPATLHDLGKRCRDEQRFLAVDTVSVSKSARLPRDLRGVSLLFANRDEAAAMTGNAKAADAGRMAQALLARGADSVIITDGENGLHWASNGDSGSLPAIRSTVRDVSGSGDALIAACLTGLLQERSLQDSLRMGLRAASLAVAVPGSINPGLQLAAIQPDEGLGEG